MTECNECGRPWGVILERGELPSDKAQHLAQLELEEELVEYLEDDFGFERGNVMTFNLESVPQAEPLEVVFVTQALADFATENLNCEMVSDYVPAWYVVADLDIPAWLLKGRKRRWAYKWDCCEMDLSKFEVVKADVGP